MQYIYIYVHIYTERDNLSRRFVARAAKWSLIGLQYVDPRAFYTAFGRTTRNDTLFSCFITSAASDGRTSSESLFSLGWSQVLPWARPTVGTLCRHHLIHSGDCLRVGVIRTLGTLKARELYVTEYLRYIPISISSVLKWTPCFFNYILKNALGYWIRCKKDHRFSI